MNLHYSAVTMSQISYMGHLKPQCCQEFCAFAACSWREMLLKFWNLLKPLLKLFHMTSLIGQATY